VTTSDTALDLTGRSEASDVPDLLDSETDQDLRAALRTMLEDRCTGRAVLAHVESGRPHDEALWQVLATDMELVGLRVPADLGGAGAEASSTAVVLEELGRAVAPVPYLGSAVIATQVLLAAGETELLGQLAAGTATAALAVPFAATPYQPPATSARLGGGRLNGTVTSVADASAAETLLVLVPEGLYAVAARDAGVTSDPVRSLDPTRPLCDITFSDAPARPVAAGADGWVSVRAGLVAGAALLASEQLGTAQWCLDTTVEYVKHRHQFGRPVGSFQAIKHRLADLWAEVTSSRAVARYAAATLDGHDPADPTGEAVLAAALAQAHCGPIAVRAAEECIQLHGGIGFTWEHPAHLYLKRAKSSAIALGTADAHRAALATLVDLAPPVR
jgi:alkylation response protein AidB-like acyl-CoA dehydrogenase